MKRPTGMLAVTLVAVATATLAFADDAAVRAELEKRLGDAVHFDLSDGKVTLEGKVKSVWDRTEAIDKAMQVDGVIAVEDRLEIASGESDKQVAEDVAKAVRRYPYFSIYDDVNVAVEEGHVTLDGRVTMPFKSDEIERRVSKVMGVQSVSSSILTLPTNIGDSKLRSALAYRIYGDPLFRDLASRVNPPIHIVVERGRVALTGAVRSEVEKRKAEHIARSTFGVFAVDNRLLVGS